MQASLLHHARFFFGYAILNQKHHAAPEWEKKCQEAMVLLQFSVVIYWDQVSRGKFFLHEHPATASSWDVPMIRELAELPMIQELAEHPGVSVVTGDMCRWGMRLSLSSSIPCT